MRDRLIKLLETDVECNKDGHGDCSMCEYKYADDKCAHYLSNIIADFLLANGVIVPQVNVGDKLYYISSVGKIVENEVWYVGAFAKGTCYTEEGTPILTSVFLDCDAHRHYYFTKEEAEKALAERSGE